MATVWCLLLQPDNQVLHGPMEMLDVVHVYGLKEQVKAKCSPTLQNIVASDLDVFQWTQGKLFADKHSRDHLQNIINSINFDKMDGILKLLSGLKMSTLGLAECEILLVRMPTHKRSREGEEFDSAKRQKTDKGALPHTPPKIHEKKVKNKVTPPRISREETRRIMFEVGCADFEEYIEYLATGKLDGYFDSIWPEKVEGLNVSLPSGPILLLHELGKYPDQDRIKNLFELRPVHLFGVSGSGKTRLSLDGLCQHWGFYISCTPQLYLACGSCDFKYACEVILGSMEAWHPSPAGEDYAENEGAANRSLSMLLCARFCVLNKLVDRIPPDTDPSIARRRWVLAQALPPRRLGVDDDLFAEVVQQFRGAQTDVMLGILKTMMPMLMTKRPDLFPTNSLHIVIDEAQAAVEMQKECFRSSKTAQTRPILRQVACFIKDTRLFDGFILAGTGLSMDKVNESVVSASARLPAEPTPVVFIDVGYFEKDNTDRQEAYINQYLTLGDSDSGQRLLERLKSWYCGRYRLTATLLEILLYAQSLDSQNVPYHRILTEVTECLTGFRLTDAIELEADEKPISQAVAIKIKDIGRLCELDRIKYHESSGLVDSLFDALMTWTMGSQLSIIPIEHDVYKIIQLGVGFLQPRKKKFDPANPGPVFICEPLVVLSLRSFFEDQIGTTRKEWVSKSFRNARDNAGKGIVLEEAILCVLMETFGGDFKPLMDAFHCDETLGSRKVRLVSLRGNPSGGMRIFPVTWKSGPSDRIGLKAGTAEDVKTFFEKLNGKSFIFPDKNMGPDLLCFLQVEGTQELILLLIQAKVEFPLQSGKLLKASSTLTPSFYQQKNGKPFAPKKHPGLNKEVNEQLEKVLEHHDSPMRQTPRRLGVVVTPDDEKRPEEKLEVPIVIMKWSLIREYMGTSADLTIKLPEHD